MTHKSLAILIAVLCACPSLAVSARAETKKKVVTAAPVSRAAQTRPALVKQPAQPDFGQGRRDQRGLPIKNEPAMGRSGGMRPAPSLGGSGNQANKPKGIADMGKEAQLRDLANPNRGVNVPDGKGFNNMHGSLPGSTTPAVSRVTVGRGDGKNSSSTSEQQGAGARRPPSLTGWENSGSNNSGGNNSGNNGSNGGGGGNRWQGDRTAHDQDRGGRSDGGGSNNSGGGQTEQRDPIHGMTAAEARAEEDRQKKGMNDTEFRDYQESMRSDHQGNMSNEEFASYAEQNKRDDRGQENMTDQEFKEYQDTVKAEQAEIDKKKSENTEPIPDEIADVVGAGGGMSYEEKMKLRARQVSLENENKRQMQPVDVQVSAKDMMNRRNGNLINPADGRDGNSVPAGGTGGGVVNGQKSPNNPTGRTTPGSNQPSPGDPKE